MKRLPAGNLFAATSSLGASCKFLQVGRTRARASSDTVLLSLEQMKSIIQAAGLLRQISGTLGLPVCAAAAADLGRCFESLPAPTASGLALPDAPLSNLINNLEYLLRTFRDEIDARPLFVLTSGAADLYDPANPLFGQAVDDAFPSAAFDVTEAGRCLATGRWTAAVMHLMRALEVPLAALAEHAGIASGTNWNKQLNEIEAKLRQVSRQDGSDEERWASEAVVQFRAIKNAWRNHAMHGRATYDEEQAMGVFEAVRALMRHLASRLSETG